MDAIELLDKKNIMDLLNEIPKSEINPHLELSNEKLENQKEGNK